MRRPYQILYSLFSLFLVRVDLTDLAPLKLSVDIIKVYDGDTVLIKKGAFEQKVRFRGVDAPEKGQRTLNHKKDAGLFSLNCLKRNLKPKGQLVIYGIDMYGRILGDIDQVSLRLIKKGCVTIYPHAFFHSQQEKYLYLREYFKARKLKQGLWAFGGFIQPKAYRKQNKYHSRKRI